MAARTYSDSYKTRTKVFLRKIVQPTFTLIWNYIPWSFFSESLGLVVVLTRVCNANCTFCAYQFLRQEERDTMSDEMFSLTVDNIRRAHVHFVHLTSNSGDPLVAPKLLDKIKALRGAGVTFIELTTNGILLDKIGIEAFLENGPDKINISTSAFEAAMYKRVYRSDQFERMRKNVMTLLHRNKERNKPRYIAVGIRPDVPKEEVLAMPETQEILALANEVNITEAYGDWNGLIKPSMLTGSMKIEPKRPLTKRPCEVLITHPAIYPNGNITACICRNVYNDPEMYLGNLKTTDLITALGRTGRKEKSHPSVTNVPCTETPPIIGQAISDPSSKGRCDRRLSIGRTEGYQVMVLFISRLQIEQAKLDV